MKKDGHFGSRETRKARTTVEGVEDAFITTRENKLEIEVQALEEMLTGDPVLIVTDYPAE